MVARAGAEPGHEPLASWVCPRGALETTAQSTRRPPVRRRLANVARIAVTFRVLPLDHSGASGSGRRARAG